MGLLSHDQILQLHAAIVSANLVESRSALLIGIDPSFVAGLPHEPTLNAQLLQDLSTLSAVGALSDGTTPLATWLKNASALAHPRIEASVFEGALRRFDDPGREGTPRGRLRGGGAVAEHDAQASGKLRITHGPFTGREFVFSTHETFIFGRGADCHLHLPSTDRWASRYHFVLEVNPPEARIRDLGSLNGTHVNGLKCGGRRADESAEEGRRHSFPEVALHHGDRIQVGDTHFEWSVKLPGPTAATVYMPHAIAASLVPMGGGGPAGSTHTLSLLEPILGTLPARGEGDAGAAEALLEMMTAEARDRGLPPPSRIGEYTLLRPLARGEMGSVYLARGEGHGAEVALKIALARVPVSAPAREAFLRKVEILKELRHRNIVRLIDHGSSGSGFWFAMDLCRGGSLSDLVARRGGKIAVREGVALALEALEGLEVAHAQGLVHGDIKPANLLLDDAAGGPLKIADLGLAKSFRSAGFSGFTVTGSSAGSPDYMPREQVINYKHANPSSDVWSMAATLYFMLTAKLPRDVLPGQDPLAAVLTSPVVPIEERDRAIPRRLADVINRCLAPEAAARPADAADMKRQLRAAI